jgi:UDP-N-acetylmuramate--alanine ligase
MFNTIKNIHFIGIGGSGMSGIAEVLFHSGYHVSGSDIKQTPITDKLKNLGLKIHIGHASENIQEAQVVVVSSAINKHNPEIIEAQQKRVPIIHRSEMLAELMRLKQGIVVAGTHGKTTSTSILAHALHDAGLDPTVVIGGQLNTFDSSAKLGKGDFFVAEADESDGSFLRLSPTIAVITNIDKDHLDYYETLDEIIKAFESFLEKVPFYGAVCLCIDDPIVQLILPKVRRKVITFGLRKDADITAENIKMDGFKTTYNPSIFGKKYDEVTFNMPGLYNVSNSLATFAVSSVLGLNFNVISKSLSHFEGVLHRYSVIGHHNNNFIIDDYAHNPKKIETVLKGTKESFPDKQIIVIFQPHRYSRIKLQLEDFAKCFADADKLIITPIYSAGENPLPGINIEILAQQIKIESFHGDSNPIFIAENFDQAVSVACQNSTTQIANKNNGCIILTLGAGDVKQVGPLILGKLRGS